MTKLSKINKNNSTMTRKWTFNSQESNYSKNAQVSLPKPHGLVVPKDTDDSGSGTVVTADMLLQSKQRQVFAVAYGPGKALLSTVFMLWMCGSSIHIFSIMTTGMALINPIKGLAATSQTFQKYFKDEGIDVKLPILIFVSLQLLSIGIALYKCSTMGLLPLTSADWTSLIPEKKYMEISAFPL